MRSGRAVSICATIWLTGCSALLGITEGNPAQPETTEGPDGTAPPRTEGGQDEAAGPDGRVADGSADSPPTSDASDAGCPGATDCERVVFVTSTTVMGNFGGVAGGDALCQARADVSTVARVKGRIFRAWLSASGAIARNRLTAGTKPYVRPDNTVVATSWTDLVDGSLAAAIDRDELGGTIAGQVWTGTNPNGTSSASTCTNWTQTGGIGQRGRSDAKAGAWSDEDTSNCTEALHLYCFEQ